jgi:hypothetical protein
VKKVRMAIGAAVPAVGMLALPATATAATSAAKTAHVAGPRIVREAWGPDNNCVGGQWKADASTYGNLIFVAEYGPAHCIDYQQATLNRAQRKLTERVRLWNNGNPNKLLQEYRRGGTISGNSTAFWSNTNYYAPEICAALVTNSTSNVQYGPACVYP